MSANSILLVSLPRSGSTVLTRILARRADVLCLPESFFPLMLDWILPEDEKSPELLAAIFMISCSDGSPLTFEEAVDCFSHGSVKGMDLLVRHLAAKDGRDADSLRAIVWKATRMVASHSTLDSLGWRYLVLKRPALNVYESQFRVPFGSKNRDPKRFALFAASYDEAFRGYPEDRTMQIDYGCIPESLDGIFKWVGSLPDAGNVGSQGILDATAGQRPWHAAIGSDFRNDDETKLANLNAKQVQGYRHCRAILDRLPFISRFARYSADRRQAGAIRRSAVQFLQQLRS